MDKTQLKLWVFTDLKKALDEKALQYGRKSGNQLAIEILTNYLKFWEQDQMATVRVPIGVGPPVGEKEPIRQAKKKRSRR